MARQELTNYGIEAAKPRDRVYRLWDAKCTGLCLLCIPAGARRSPSPTAARATRSCDG